MKDVQTLNITCSVPYFVKRGEIPKVLRQKTQNTPVATVQRQPTRQATCQPSPDSFKDNNFRHQLKTQLQAIKEMDMRKVQRQRKYIADIKSQHESTMNRMQQQQYEQRKAAYRQLKHICSKKCTNCPFRTVQQPTKKEISLILVEDQGMKTRLDQLIKEYERKKVMGQLSQRKQTKMREEIQKLKKLLNGEDSRQRTQATRGQRQRNSIDSIGRMTRQSQSLIHSANNSPQQLQKSYSTSSKAQLKSSDFINRPKISRRQSLNINNLINFHNSSFRKPRRSQINSQELKSRLNLLTSKKTEDLKTLWRSNRKRNIHKIKQQFQEFVQRQDQKIEVVDEKQEEQSESEEDCMGCTCGTESCQNRQNRKQPEPIHNYYSVYKKKTINRIEKAEQKWQLDKQQPTIALKHCLNEYFRRKQLPQKLQELKEQFLSNQESIQQVSRNLDGVMEKQLQPTEDMAWINQINFNHKILVAQEDPLIIPMNFKFDTDFMVSEEREEVRDNRQAVRTHHFAEETKAIMDRLNRQEQDLMQCIIK